MRVTRITPFLIAAQPSVDGWSKGQITLLIKLETETGLIGWGEAYALQNRQRAIREIITSLGAALIELPEASPRAFLHHIAKPMDSKHPSIDYASAVSAIEIALWDLAGKAAGLPVHAMLGGAIRDHIPIYANAWDNPVQPPEAIAARCAAMCAEGYQAVKIYPLRQATLALSHDVVRLTRAAIGPDTDLLLDFACPSDPRRALQAIHLFAPYAPYWIEEPVTGDDPATLAEVRAQTDLRIVTGERQAGLPHFNAVLNARAADVLNPDIAGVGGILTTLEIGAMAQARSVSISPHSWNSTTVALMAMLHVCAVMPNATYAELYYDYLAMGKQFATCDTVIKNGFASLPRQPGLGIEIDENALQPLLCST